MPTEQEQFSLLEQIRDRIIAKPKALDMSAWLAEAKSDQRKKREESSFLAYEHHDGAKMVYADFHALRHTGITRVCRRAGLKIAQAWADHSTPVLTSKYSHLDLPDEDLALDALPPADLHKQNPAEQGKRIG